MHPRARHLAPYALIPTPYSQMFRDTLRLCAVLLTAISTAAGLAHLFAMPNKMKLSGPDYFITQRAYDGWALLGIVMVAAIAATVWVAAAMRGQPERKWAFISAGLMAAGMVVFFGRVFPANRATENWTVRPDNWEVLRRQWEAGHAFNATLYFVALVFIVLAVIRAPSGTSIRS
jgi:hypothetical protein